MNGRINIVQPNTNVLLQMKDKEEIEVKDFRGALTGIWSDTKLSDLYFSSENMKLIQNGIRSGVYKMSGNQYIVGIQDYDELKIIMRALFIQNSKNSKTNIKEEIYRLNQLVLDYSIKNVYNEAVSYLKYINDASTMYNPMQKPAPSSNRHKPLTLKEWF